MGDAGSTANRFHDLDALRAFAMLLGILLHASVFLLSSDQWPEDQEPWPVYDEWGSTVATENNPYAYLFSIIHGFRMPVFFIVSGFFTAMLWQSRGLYRLARHRLVRIGVPLLVSAFTVVPLLLWLWESDRFKGLMWLLAPFYRGFYHLWFLWYLLLMLALMIVLVRLGRVNFSHPAWWLLVPLAVVPQYFMHGAAGIDTPPPSIVPSPHVFGIYATFFFFGVFFYQRKVSVRKWWAVFIPPAILLVYPAAIIAAFPELFLGFEPAGSWSAATVLNVAFAWLMSFGFIGLFRWVASRERFWVRYMSDASYWMYVCHLPLVIAGQILIADWPMNVHLKFVLLCAGVVFILLVSYQLAVRHTVIGRTMNGPRARR